MTTGLQEAELMDSEEGKSVSSLAEPEYQYRFREGDEIANRYKVISALGVGGFSEVYRCHDLRLDRDVAVKVLTGKGLGLEEARAAARLKHPNIVQVYDMPRSLRRPLIIVFDYVEGETLEVHLTRAQYRRLPLNEDTLRIVHEISEALDYAHTEGVVHRDVKPSNIILNREGKAFLTDFGLAEVKRWAEGKGQAERMSMLSLSVDDQKKLSGTIPYMAPEQLAERNPGDKRSDLYSLGVVVYEMLTGQLPYRGRDFALISQIITSDPFPPTQANPELPREVEAVLLRTLDKKPEQRYSSCLAFAEELEKAAQTYVETSRQYEQARRHFEAKQWRQARAAFEALQQQYGDFRDTTRYLEQARRHVRLLELYEQARDALKKQEYQTALDALNALTRSAPNYDVASFRAKALEGLAQEEKRSLAEQYQQAVQQFRNKEYEACSDTLAVIHERDPNYPDPESIVTPTQEHVERQRHLQDLYTRGVEQMTQERWDEAITIFQELQKESPDYRDVEARLVMARHMARLSFFLQEAKTHLEAEAFSACIERVDKLQRVDADYRQDEVAWLRKEVLNRLHRRAERLLREEAFEDSLTSLDELRGLAPDYPGLNKLTEQAREGIRNRNLMAVLGDLYQQAEERLEQQSYAEAFEFWQEIQRQKGDLEYPDKRKVESQARRGLCITLYGQALGALAQGEPRQALELWHHVQEVDLHYPDSQQIERRAQAMELYHQALEALDQEDPRRALELWQQVRHVDPHYPDSQRAEQQAQAMGLYNQALKALDQNAPYRALELWRQVHEVDPHYADSRRIEQRVQAMDLYNQALEALAQKSPRQALELWGKARAIVRDYTDNQRVEERARKMIERQGTVRRLVFFLGGGGIIVLLLVGIFAVIVITRGCLSPAVTSTGTPSPRLTTSVPEVISPVTPAPVITSSPKLTSVPPSSTPPPPASPIPPPTTGTLATALQGASIFAAPDSDSRVLGGIRAGDQVPVLGRSAYGQWFYIRSDRGVEGFVYAPRFDWSGDYDSLPVKGPIGPLPTAVPTRPVQPLEMDLWALDGTDKCSGGIWYKSVFIQGRGGNGVYTYYWKGERIAGPTSEPYTFEVYSTGGAIIARGRVESGDGQVVERDLFVEAHCP